ncbi:hypothetical protein M427DRAFT_134377 [Gonapodya prolifera JEL478]|uniref:Uncharacterized protein n=1 Tax=Gonapodya prolifera (strain JEL478) TaxID=1344416 RepID=A0A139AI38_GONPJ|nr:hypothetical protein M427DRAFT_134377 [Gonapodya prolifera JEL478]|eukprot:KXS16369.1 hypothetical protein M427DRAFT_134377 [Gonapodya prolifera JEL478]
MQPESADDPSQKKSKRRRTASDSSSLRRITLGQPEHMYILVQLVFEPPKLLTEAFYKAAVHSAVQESFGVIGSGMALDVVSFRQERGECCLRVPANHYVSLRAALTACNSSDGVACRFSILRASPFLLALSNDTQIYP